MSATAAPSDPNLPPAATAVDADVRPHIDATHTDVQPPPTTHNDIPPDAPRPSTPPNTDALPVDVNSTPVRPGVKSAALKPFASQHKGLRPDLIASGLMQRVHCITVDDFFTEYMKHGGDLSDNAYNAYNKAAGEADLSTCHLPIKEGKPARKWKQKEWQIVVNLVRPLFRAPLLPLILYAVVQTGNGGRRLCRWEVYQISRHIVIEEGQRKRAPPP